MHSLRLAGDDLAKLCEFAEILIMDTKRQLILVHPPKASYISELFDEQVIKERIRFALENSKVKMLLAEYMLSAIGILKEACAPVRDSQLLKVEKLMLRTFKGHGGLEETCIEFFELLRTLRMDMARCTMVALQSRPDFIKMAIDYERKHFEKNSELVEATLSILDKSTWSDYTTDLITANENAPIPITTTTLQLDKRFIQTSREEFAAIVRRQTVAAHKGILFSEEMQDRLRDNPVYKVLSERFKQTLKRVMEMGINEQEFKDQDPFLQRLYRWTRFHWAIHGAIYRKHLYCGGSWK